MQQPVQTPAAHLSWRSRETVSDANEWLVVSRRDKYRSERKRARLDERTALQSARNEVRASLKVTPLLP